MANDLNMCQFIGRLGQDPKMRQTADGGAVANMSIAVGWKSKDKEGAEWISLVAFGKLAEICGQYLKKGSQIYAQGRMQTRKWQDKEGNERSTTEILLDQMQMVGGKSDSGEKDKPSKPATPRKAAADEPNDDIPW